MGAKIETLKLSGKFMKAGAQYRTGKSTAEQYLAAIDKALSEHPNALADTIKGVQQERTEIAEKVKTEKVKQYIKNLEI